MKPFWNNLKEQKSAKQKKESFKRKLSLWTGLRLVLAYFK
jgi:hypothetical protein